MYVEMQATQATALLKLSGNSPTPTCIGDLGANQRGVRVADEIQRNGIEPGCVASFVVESLPYEREGKQREHPAG